MMSEWNVPDLIDHTVLRPDATRIDVLRLCQEAKEHRFTVIFVPPCYVDDAVAVIAGTAILVGIPIGFPLGGHTTKTKVAESVEAVARGAKVLDMVINVSRLKSGDYDFVRNDMAEVVKATAGVERTDGIVGRQVSFNQPLLTNGKAVSCTYGTPPPPPPPAPTIQTTTLPGGTVGQAYSQTMAATGGTPPYTWSLDSGSLPAGLALNSTTGALTGSPTSSGSSLFVAKVTDNAAQSDTQELSIAVAPAPVPPPAITTASLPGGTVGVFYNQTLAASGGTTPYSWSLASGSLPAGLSLNSSTGAITGIPAGPGTTTTFTARVTEAGASARSDTQGLSIAIVVAPLAIATTSLPSGIVGVPYSQTLAATGGVPSYTWTRIAGKLPNGLTLNSSTGAITGKPSKWGTYTFTLRVTDTQGTQASKSFTVQINRP